MDMNELYLIILMYGMYEKVNEYHQGFSYSKFEG